MLQSGTENNHCNGQNDGQPFLAIQCVTSHDSSANLVQADIWKILSKKINAGYTPGPAVKIFQLSRVGGKREGERPGAKSLMMPFQLAVLLLAAILAVTQQRTAGCCHLRTDLMRSAGDQLTFYQRQSVLHRQSPIVGNGSSTAGDRLVID